MRVAPLILIIVGAVFLAGNLGLFSLHQLSELLRTWWPLILIAVGIGGLVGNRRSHK